MSYDDWDDEHDRRHREEQEHARRQMRRQARDNKHQGIKGERETSQKTAQGRRRAGTPRDY